MPSCGGRRVEPIGERISEPQPGSLTHTGDISVGPDQHGVRSRDRTKHRKLQPAGTFGVDQPDPIRPFIR